MTVAINTKYFLKEYQQDFSEFILHLFKGIAVQQPLHSFIFFSDAAFDPAFTFSGNMVAVIIKTKAVSSAISYKLKVASLLKKYNATIFVNADAYSSLLTNIPEYFISYQPGGLSDKNFTRRNKLSLYKKIMAPALKGARLVITDSEFSRNYISQQYKLDEQKIDVVYPLFNENGVRMKWEEREKIKTTYAQGNEYFIFSGDTSQLADLLNLLKAFSHFKKWQKSSMQLLIIKNNILHKDFEHNLTTYKYRDDVKVLKNVNKERLSGVVGAAYAMIHLPGCNGFYNVALQGISYGVPVITPGNNNTAELLGDAALYINNQYKDLAEKLMFIFKNENSREELIEKGNKRTEQLSHIKTPQALWQSIVKSMK